MVRLEDNWGHLCVSAGGMCAGASGTGVLDNTCVCLQLQPSPGPEQSPDVVFPNFGQSSTRAGAEQAPTHHGIMKGCP